MKEEQIQQLYTIVSSFSRATIHNPELQRGLLALQDAANKLLHDIATSDSKFKVGEKVYILDEDHEIVRADVLDIDAPVVSGGPFRYHLRESTGRTFPFEYTDESRVFGTREELALFYTERLRAAVRK